MRGERRRVEKRRETNAGQERRGERIRKRGGLPQLARWLRVPGKGHAPIAGPWARSSFQQAASRCLASGTDGCSLATPFNLPLR